MHHLKKFSPEGPCKNVSPGPAVALDGPVGRYVDMQYFGKSTYW